MNAVTNKEIGLRLRDLRRQSDCSQEELAYLLRRFCAPISRSLIANWETGRTVLPACWIPLLSFVLQGKVGDLLPDLTLKDLAASPRKRRSRK